MRLLLVTGRTLLSAAFVIAVILGLWVLGLKWLDVPTFVGRGPHDVYNFLFTAPGAGANRHDVWVQLRQTLIDAGVGFVAGMVVAVGLATGIVLSRAAESAVMPVALVLRSVPLVALAPILALIFGNGYAVVAAMSGIVVLFPALVNVVYGLRSVSRQMSDVVHVYGGSAFTSLRKLGFPSAMPAVFASIRISVPGAITGALLAEGLSTGKGIGNAVVIDSASNISEFWALVVAVTFASIVLYQLARLIEGLVLPRFGRDASRV